MPTKRTETYPFEPKSNARLRPGHFWTMPLSDGRYACGFVLDTLNSHSETCGPSREGSRTLFMGALLDWVSEKHPTPDAIVGSRVLTQGQAGPLCIIKTGGTIVGRYPPHEERPAPQLRVSSRGPNAHLHRGYECLGLATAEQRASLRTENTWGYRVPQIQAEAYFVRGENVSFGERLGE